MTCSTTRKTSSSILASDLVLVLSFGSGCVFLLLAHAPSLSVVTGSPWFVGCSSLQGAEGYFPRSFALLPIRIGPRTLPLGGHSSCGLLVAPLTRRLKLGFSRCRFAGHLVVNWLGTRAERVTVLVSFFPSSPATNEDSSRWRSEVKPALRRAGARRCAVAARALTSALYANGYEDIVRRGGRKKIAPGRKIKDRRNESCGHWKRYRSVRE